MYKRYSIVFFIFIFIPGAFTKKLPTTKSEMNLLIKKEKKKIEKIKRQELSILKNIDTLQTDIFESDKELVKIKFNMKQHETQVTTLKQSVERAQKQIIHQRELVASIANKIHRFFGKGKYLFLQALLDAKDISNFRKNLKLTELFISKYFESAIKLEADINNNKKRLAELSNAATRLNHLHKKQEQVLQNRKYKKHKLVSVLKNIEKKKHLHLKFLSELKSAQKRLDKKMASFRKSKSKLSGLIHFKGKLIPPLDGKITQKYGRQVNKRFHTILFNKGVVITSNGSNKIRAIHSGKVVFSDWFKGYGNMIIIHHGKDYYSLYSKIAQRKIKKGAFVKQGDIIGSAMAHEPGRPQVYFELRKERRTLNPTIWLKF